MKTYGIKYIGSKNKLISLILELALNLRIKSAIDVFTGTTRVAQGLKQGNIITLTSDLSWASTAYSHTFIANPKSNGHLLPFVYTLNNLSPKEGWLTANYCGEKLQDEERSDGRLFQRKNTMKADAIRDRIEILDLEPWEKYTLITSLIFALDKVDNTVGVQQAYLKEWCSRSYKNIVLELPQTVFGQQGKHIEGNALTIDYPNMDLAYLDPPYSAHSYATYYHVWDSITRWDKPKTDLKVNRRIDRVAGSESYDASFDSVFNKKIEALNSLIVLMSRLPVRYILLSYNDESLILKEELLKACQKIGKTTISVVNFKRNIMCQIGNAMKLDTEIKTKNQELLILIKK